MKKRRENGRRGWERLLAGKAGAPLGETHGDCVLQRFPAEGGDARAPPHVAAVRGAAELRRARHVAGAWQGSGHHARESGLVEVRL